MSDADRCLSNRYLKVAALTDSGGPLLPPLEYTLKVNKLEMAKFLIANKADVNLAAKAGGDAPLHLAASNKGAAAVIILLVGAGARAHV